MNIPYFYLWCFGVFRPGHITPSRYRQNTYVCLLGLMLLNISGCTASQVQTKSVDNFTISGDLHQMPHTTLGKWVGDMGRVTEVLPSSIRQFDWGLLDVTSDSNSQSSNDLGPQVIHAKALLPDDRQASMVIWQSGDTLHMAIRVGHFGDAELEIAFMSHFADMLRVKPKKKKIKN